MSRCKLLEPRKSCFINTIHNVLSLCCLFLILMPIYTFYNKRTKKEFDNMMSISEMEEYLNKNKHITQVIKGINIVASVGNRTMKTDSGFNEVLSKIGEAHPQSALAKQTSKKSIKQIKTEQALAKNRRRLRGKK